MFGALLTREGSLRGGCVYIHLDDNAHPEATKPHRTPGTHIVIV